MSTLCFLYHLSVKLLTLPSLYHDSYVLLISAVFVYSVFLLYAALKMVLHDNALATHNYYGSFRSIILQNAVSRQWSKQISYLEPTGVSAFSIHYHQVKVTIGFPLQHLNDENGHLHILACERDFDM